MTVTSVLVNLGINAAAIRADITSIVSNDVQAFTDLNDFKTGAYFDHPYITHEPNYWLLDGDFKFMPANPDAGFVSIEMSGAGAGDLDAAPPEITIEFGSMHSTSGITLLFSKSGDYHDMLAVTFFLSGVGSTTMYYPTGITFTTGAVAAFDKILIKFHSTSRPQRFARLLNIDFDTITVFTGVTIRTANLVEEIDPLSMTLSIDTLELKLFSSDAAFSVVNPTGVYSDLQRKQPLDVSEIVDGSTVFIGRFYLDRWESLSENEAIFYASDAVGILDAQTFLGGLWSYSFYPLPGVFAPIASQDIIALVMAAANQQYTLDAALLNIDVTGWLPICTCRDALQQIAFAIGAYITCSRSSMIQIKPLRLLADVAVVDETILRANMGMNSPVELIPLVTDVEVIANDFTYNGTVSEIILDVTLPIGTHRVLFNKPVWDWSVAGTGTTSSMSMDKLNYSDLVVDLAGTFIFTATAVFDLNKKQFAVNASLGAYAARNVVKIDNATLVNSTNAQAVAQRVYDYYQQRYKQKTKLFAPTAQVGDVVLIDTQSSRQIKGIVEKMATNLSGGFVADAEIIGVVV